MSGACPGKGCLLPAAGAIAHGKVLTQSAGRSPTALDKLVSLGCETGAEDPCAYRLGPSPPGRRPRQRSGCRAEAASGPRDATARSQERRTPQLTAHNGQICCEKRNVAGARGPVLR